MKTFPQFLKALPFHAALFAVGTIALAVVLGVGILLVSGAFSGEAFAQTLSLDMGSEALAGGTSMTGRVVQLVALMTVLSLAPSILIMMTSFTRIAIVLSFVRTAIGTQQSPPNVVIVSLAMFLTFFIMQPVLQQSYTDGIQPLIEERMEEVEAFEASVKPFQKFMLANTREEDLKLFADMSPDAPFETVEETPLHVVIPAFMISELRTAFAIGFLVFVPFLVIDMVVASILMAMGMMMVPPVIISLPFKIIFFVLVDGWNMLASSLVKGYNL